MKINLFCAALAAPLVLSACSGVQQGELSRFTDTQTGRQYGYVDVAGRAPVNIGYEASLHPHDAEQAYFAATGQRVRIADIQYGCAQRDSSGECENGKP